MNEAVGAAAPPQRAPSWWWAGAVAALHLVVVGLLWPVLAFAALLLVWTLLVKLPALALPRARGTRRRRLQIIALYLIVATLLMLRVDRAEVESRAARELVSSAVLAWQQQHGRYPPELQALVPAQLPTVPVVRHGRIERSFRYALPKEGPPLLFQRGFWLDGHAFDFESKRWEALD